MADSPTDGTGLDPAVRSADVADRRLLDHSKDRTMPLPRTPHPQPRHRRGASPASPPPSPPARRTAATAAAVRARRGRRRHRRQPGGLHRQRPLAGGLLRGAARLVRRARRGPGRPLGLGPATTTTAAWTTTAGDRSLRARRGGAASQSATTGAAAAPAPLRVTNGENGTNVQELGVDEPDVGEDRRPHAVPGRGRRPGDLRRHRRRGRAARLGRPARRRPERRDPARPATPSSRSRSRRRRRSTAGPDGPEPRCVTLDVSDPAAPRSTHTVEYDTGLVTARLHDGVVRLVLQAGLPELDFVTAGAEQHDDGEASRANQQLVRESTIEDWLPTVTVDGGEAEQFLDCDQVAVPDDGNTLGTIAVVGFDAPATRRALGQRPGRRHRPGLRLGRPALPRDQPDVRRHVGCFDCMTVPVPRPVREHLPAGSRRRAAPTTGRRPAPATSTPSTSTASTPRSRRRARWTALIRDRWSMDASTACSASRSAPPTAPATSTRSSPSARRATTWSRPGGWTSSASARTSSRSGGSTPSPSWSPSARSTRSTRSTSPTPTNPSCMGELKIPGFSAYLHPLGPAPPARPRRGPGRERQAGARRPGCSTSPT